ncbi:MAG TPA: hypothetical protein VHL34_06065 [Rhizomicrobium sp.]|jgi:Flp pilus assembly protein TadB|nr:hypothetical protein [Rhizomicrobium sp.]
MPKIGVNVGDEFPIDESEPKNEAPNGEKDQDGQRGCGPRHEDWRARWREHHERWHRSGPFRSGRSNLALPLAALIAIGAIALLVAIISHIFYVLLGAAMVMALFAMKRHHDWDDLYPRGTAPVRE